MNRCLTFSAIAAIFVLSLTALGQKNSTDLPKLSVDEIIGKHVASLGSFKPGSLTSRVLVGTGEFSSKVQGEKVGGPVQFASAGSKLLLALVFNQTIILTIR